MNIDILSGTLLDDIKAIAIFQEDGYMLHTQNLGDIILSPRNDGAVYSLSGNKSFAKAFERDFHTRQYPDGGFVIVTSIFPAVIEWLEFAVGASARKESIQRRKKEYAEQISKLLEKGMTEVESVAKSRVGQEILRKELLSSKGRCEVTGIAIPELLWVSHIKNWSKCNDEERLDMENVLLLARNLDALFDQYLISFDCHTGQLLKAGRIDDVVLTSFGIPSNWRDGYGIPKPSNVRARYLQWHKSEMDKRDVMAGCSEC